MSNVGDSLVTAFENLGGVIEGTSQYTLRSEGTELQAKAMNAIENDEGLSDNDLTDAGLALAKFPTLANLYLTMKSKTARTNYLFCYMEMLKKET